MVENNNPKVSCCICGKRIVNISLHLTLTHQMSKLEYLEKYPDADMNTSVLAAMSSKGGSACRDKYAGDHEFFRRRVKNLDYAARNKTRHETYLREGLYEKHAEKMKLKCEDPLYIEKLSMATTEKWKDPLYRKKIEDFHLNRDPLDKQSWQDNISKTSLNMSPEKRAKIDQARLESSKLGSKKERKLFELLCEKYPEGDWKLHTFIQTGDPYSKSGMRQIDMMSKTWNLYIEWNGYLHFINPWGDTEHLANIQNIEIWKKEAVEKKGGIYISIKDWNPVISFESALKIIEAHIPSEPIYNNDLFV